MCWMHPYTLTLFFLSYFHFICSKALLIKNTNEITGNKPCLHTEIRAVESWRLEESTTITKSHHPHHNHCRGLSATSSPFLARAFFPSHSRLWSEFLESTFFINKLQSQTKVPCRRICNGCVAEMKFGRHLHVCVAFTFSNWMHFQTARTSPFYLFRNKAETAYTSFWK